ncbi:hypothetical protein [Clostridium sp. FP1]|uniref:hypothetical protein n=1 Tax=Clostridium sp. FP1 TaxID=2724076 RepID=UPI0013E95675|nr:hypothetical protein [Clostridium sp. FP1]MBZ9637420.1 hypothetical protein [Clostridium sp. FP1]
MKKHYILIFVPIVISILVIFNGCNNSEVSNNKQSINKDTKEISETYKSIYDDEERIASNSGGAYYSRYAMDMQKDIISGEIGGFYGELNYWILDAKEAGKITLNYNLEFGKEGKYKLLLCTPDKKLIKIFEHTSGDSTEKNELTIDIAKGVNRVVAIGNNATAKVYISIKTQEDIEIKDFTSTE